MTLRQLLKALLAATVGTLAVAPALAQNVSNEAWIGQLGGANSLSIIQEGRSNSAGADNIYLLLSQQGVGNSLVLLQSGYANKVGTLFGDELEYARGVWQTGDINKINISQSNTLANGSNMIGAVQQLSAANILTGAANTLSVVQNADGGIDGAADHYIGRLVQANTTGVGEDNVADILQTGGGTNRGNVLANLYQNGSGNRFGLIQTGQANQVGETIRAGGVWQLGVDNGGYLIQDGESNLLEYLEQYGQGNTARMRQSGDRNAVASIDQDSVGFGQDGNTLEIVMSGVDNGGSGSGFVGEFLALTSLRQTGVMQGIFRQYGGANNARLTITAGAESKYGLTQDGDGNQAFVTIASAVPTQLAMRNETAIYQNGSLNEAVHQILGDDNAASIFQRGRRNVVAVTQNGTGNVAVVDVVGDDNNKPPVALFGPALDTLALAPLGTGLGVVLQEGDKNSVDVRITGSSNGMAVYQSGTGNSALSTIVGNNNALAVLQQGGLNTSITTQNGNSNALEIVQF